jgi:hypothetical protein
MIKEPFLQIDRNEDLAEVIERVDEVHKLRQAGLEQWPGSYCTSSCNQPSFPS